MRKIATDDSDFLFSNIKSQKINNSFQKDCNYSNLTIKIDENELKSANSFQVSFINLT